MSLAEWLFGKKKAAAPVKVRSVGAGHNARRVSVGRGLTRKEAKRRALRLSPGDFRAFSYNARTGKAVLT